MKTSFVTIDVVILSQYEYFFKKLLFQYKGYIFFGKQEASHPIWIEIPAIALFGLFSGILMPLIDFEKLHYLRNECESRATYGKIR